MGSIKNKLKGKCCRFHCRNFGFFDCGAVYLAPALMAADEVPLSHREKRKNSGPGAVWAC